MTEALLLVYTHLTFLLIGFGIAIAGIAKIDTEKAKKNKSDNKNDEKLELKKPSNTTPETNSQVILNVKKTPITNPGDIKEDLTQIADSALICCKDVRGKVIIDCLKAIGENITIEDSIKQAIKYLNTHAKPDNDKVKSTSLKCFFEKSQTTIEYLLSKSPGHGSMWKYATMIDEKGNRIGEKREIQ